ncbi:hypothetical protein [Bradyrhizobium sp. STM 3561]
MEARNSVDPSPAAQVRKALDGCDRETVMGRRDHANLLLLAKLGL